MKGGLSYRGHSVFGYCRSLERPLDYAMALFVCFSDRYWFLIEKANELPRSSSSRLSRPLRGLHNSLCGSPLDGLKSTHLL